MQTQPKCSTVGMRSAKLLSALLIVVLSMTFLAGTALAADDPALDIIDDGEALIRGDVHSFEVPIYLDPADKTLSGVAFGVEYDHDCLTFDINTDSNNDGVPDSVTKPQSGFDIRVRHKDVTGDGAKDVIVAINARRCGPPPDLGPRSRIRSLPSLFSKSRIPAATSWAIPGPWISTSSSMPANRACPASPMTWASQ